MFVANANSKKDLKEWYKQKNKKGVHRKTMNKSVTISPTLPIF
jgi:hypothetical protein